MKLDTSISVRAVFHDVLHNLQQCSFYFLGLLVDCLQNLDWSMHEGILSSS